MTAVSRQRLVFLLRKQSHLSREQFQRYWWDHHAPLVRARAEVLGIRRYQQVHTVQHLGPEGADEIDGVAELWVDGPAPTGTREQVAAAGLELLEDERTFIALARSPIFLGAEHHLQEGPREGLRLTGVVMRQPTVTREAFQDYWVGHHGPTALARPDAFGIGEYYQVHAPVDAERNPLAVHRGAPPAPEGIAEAWLSPPTLAAAEADALRAALREADAPYFDYSRTVRFMGEVRPVFER